MDETGISDRKLREDISKVKEESVPKMKEYEEKLEIVGERGSYSKTDPDTTWQYLESFTHFRAVFGQYLDKNDRLDCPIGHCKSLVFRLITFFNLLILLLVP